jgi:hypothetical protein
MFNLEIHIVHFQITVRKRRMRRNRESNENIENVIDDAETQEAH